MHTVSESFVHAAYIDDVRKTGRLVVAIACLKMLNRPL
jgi:hypothetical protein